MFQKIYYSAVWIFGISEKNLIVANMKQVFTQRKKDMQKI
ncbi:MAG: hypothetical protein SCABRO_02560 [Candidatus Scalindua brodae]|uniref:Uncharacterized protein n=1 Tax=Candidatus Scalindua brodae TaxID=237368 RepID=A0A0B0EI03_9BACT|nr:MAG: hypothetical protein SCABRO_02560 [Candidatus Scalindua brodae]